MIQVKLDICFKESTNQQTEIDELKAEKQDYINKIIELENCNDDLERSRRIIEESMAGFEQALNSALEKNAMLENEVDEKEHLRENLQRLADEVRGNLPALHYLVSSGQFLRITNVFMIFFYTTALFEKAYVLLYSLAYIPIYRQFVYQICKTISISDLKQELLVKEKERAPDNERYLNGFKSPSRDNRLKENETQTTPNKRKNTRFNKAYRSFRSKFCSKKDA